MCQTLLHPYPSEEMVPEPVSPKVDKASYTDSQKLYRNGIVLIQIIEQSVRVTGT